MYALIPFALCILAIIRPAAAHEWQAIKDASNGQRDRLLFLLFDCGILIAIGCGLLLASIIGPDLASWLTSGNLPK